MYFHNAGTFKQMWAEVAEKTATEWTVEASVCDMLEWGQDKEDYAWMGPDRKGVDFVCTRS